MRVRVCVCVCVWGGMALYLPFFCLGVKAHSSGGVAWEEVQASIGGSQHSVSEHILSIMQRDISSHHSQLRRGGGGVEGEGEDDMRM